MRIGFDLVGKKGVKAVDATKEEFAPGAFVISPLIKLIALQAITDPVICKGLSLGVESGQAIVGADPKLALLVF